MLLRRRTVPVSPQFADCHSGNTPRTGRFSRL